MAPKKILYSIPVETIGGCESLAREPSPENEVELSIPPDLGGPADNAKDLYLLFVGYPNYFLQAWRTK